MDSETFLVVLTREEIEELQSYWAQLYTDSTGDGYIFVSGSGCEDTRTSEERLNDATIAMGRLRYFDAELGTSIAEEVKK